ncbi:MAG: response regulator, partial [Ignavibacteriae bacterium]|nr:response regulator [Ignavibacteriota bacterium]
MRKEIFEQNNAAETTQQDERQHTQSVPKACRSMWIVEDEPHIRDEAQLMLNAIEGISCTTTFASGEDALQQLSKTTTPPNIVLLDIRMEGMNGLEVLQRIRKLHPETLVIMMTNYADDQYIQKALDHGASGYVLKDDLWDNFGKYL